MLLKKPVILMLLISLVSACSAVSAAPPTATPAEGVTLISPPVVIQDFTLTSTNNTPFSLNNLKGKFSILTFGYTNCPDVCPITLANFRLVKKMLGDDASRVNFVFVSVDGKRDTPDVLAKHLQIFDSTFIGLTGDDSIVAPVAKSFYVSYILNPPDTSGNYTVTHTASWFLLDTQGRMTRIYDYGADPKIITADLEGLIHAQS